VKAEIKQESMSDYNSAPGFRASDIKILFESPKRYKWEVIDGKRPEPSPSILFGQLCHDAILEPKRFRENMVVKPKFSGTGMKKAKADWMETLKPGAIVIEEEEAVQIEGMIQSILDYPDAAGFFKRGVVERSIYWTDERSGMPFKCRPDVITEDGWIVNLKTARDASYFKFRNQCAELGYFVQAAMYTRGYRAMFGCDPKGYVYIPVEKEPPYEVAVYQADNTHIEQGDFVIDSAIITYKECMESGYWFGIQREPRMIDFPKWMEQTE